jgi:YD repeat-containing protein
LKFEMIDSSSNSNSSTGWMVYPGGEQVDYSYTASGALAGIEGQAVYAQGMIYDAAGRLTELVRGANIITAYDYYAWNEEGGRLETQTTGSL